MEGNQGAGVKSAAKITSKGRITLPVDVRRILRVREGDSVVFEKQGDGGWVLRKRVKKSKNRADKP
jgi:AbrB family looped-hinge helix DNA binding protein